LCSPWSSYRWSSRALFARASGEQRNHFLIQGNSVQRRKMGEALVQGTRQTKTQLPGVA